MRRQARSHWWGQSMARKTYGPATCLHTTTPLYPLSSPRLFFPLKSPRPLLSPTLLPPRSIPCWVAYNPKTFFPVSHNKSHSDSNPLPNLQADPAESLHFTYQVCVTQVPGADIPSDSPGRSQVGGFFLRRGYWVPPPATVPQGFAVRTETSLLITQPITLDISRLNIQSRSKSIYQSHENNISKFKANVFGKSSCSPLVLSCGVLD